jgi:hypothetical protein
MIRPKWTPTDLQRRLAEAVEVQFKDVDNREAQAWRKFVEARDAGVPVTHLVERSRRPRPTVYRKLDELGYGDPAKKVWTLTITGDMPAARLREFMHDAGASCKPTRVGNTVQLSLVGEDGEERLSEIAEDATSIGCTTTIT